MGGCGGFAEGGGIVVIEVEVEDGSRCLFVGRWRRWGEVNRS